MRRRRPSSRTSQKIAAGGRRRAGVSAAEAQATSAAAAGARRRSQATESQDAGVQRAGSMLAAATSARWPMYLRNVKQILRAADGGFDERRYGFGGLMDLLKACQRDGLRAHRARSPRRPARLPGPVAGGNAASRPTHSVQPAAARRRKRDHATMRADRGAAGEPVAVDRQRRNAWTIEQSRREPIPIDTTAELLGRAKPRKPRVARRACRGRRDRARGACGSAKAAENAAARAKKAATTLVQRAEPRVRPSLLFLLR